MTGLVPGEVVVALLVVAVAVTLGRARRRRVRDLALLAAVGTALSPPGAGAARPEPWSEALPILRAHLGARRVAVTGRAAGTPDLAEHLPVGPVGAAWTRRTAPAAVAEMLAQRDLEEILVVSLPSRVGGLGTLEVHDPARPWWSRWRGARRRTELALLRTVAGQISAVVEATRVEERLRRDVRHDSLTGLLNRTGFLQVAGPALAGHHPGGVAVVAFSLLDQVTDSVGHARGERFVALAAERLAAACARPWFPGPAVVARLEGDTFALLLPETDPHAADALAERVRQQLVSPCLLEELPFEAPVHVGVALDTPSLVLETLCGPARTPGPDGPLESDSPRVAALLRRADVALAAARRGGPVVRRYEPAMGEQAARRLAVIRGFPEAIATGQVRVHYQPTVALRGQGAPECGAVLGVEALARWRHPELGELLPDEFVPVLEATGQITELTRFVLDEALTVARGWLDTGLRLSVAVNVPVGNLADPAFPDEVAARLARHGVPAELLTLELTESGVSAEREAALPVLRRLHVLGARLAVDDFGTGQSSLAHLRRLPVDQVKIDKSFVMGMETELGDMAVVRAIVEMGHTLGLTVVAEGVEQVAVRSALAEMGCDVAQGYLVSRPLPVGRLERWLATLATVPVVPGGEDGPLTLIA